MCSYCADGDAGDGMGIVARDDKGDLMQAWSVSRESLDNSVVEENLDNSVVAECEVLRIALLVVQ